MDEWLDGVRWWVLDADESAGLVAGARCAHAWALVPTTRLCTQYAPMAAGTRIREAEEEMSVAGCILLAADICRLESNEAG